MAAEVMFNPTSSVALTVGGGPSAPRKPEPLPVTGRQSGAEPQLGLGTQRPDKLAYLISNSENGPKISRTYVRFEVDDKTHEVKVSIFDASTGEMVRQYPPSALASLADRMKVYHGVLVEHLV